MGFSVAASVGSAFVVSVPAGSVSVGACVLWSAGASGSTQPVSSLYSSRVRAPSELYVLISVSLGQYFSEY